MHGVAGAELPACSTHSIAAIRETPRAPARRHGRSTTMIFARLERARGVEHVREQRPAGERMQHLGQRGMHALALTRGENDDF